MFTALLAGAIAQGMGARRAATAAKQQRKMLQQQQNNDTANFLQGLHEVSDQSAGEQARMAQLRQTAERMNGNARNAAIAGNLTHEQQLAANQHTAQTMAAAVNQQQVRQTAARQQLRNQHQQEMARVGAAQRKLKQEEAHNWSHLGTNLSKALVSALSLRKKPD